MAPDGPGFGVDWSPVADVLIVPAPASTLDPFSGLPVPVTALYAVPPVTNARALAQQVTFLQGSSIVTVDDVQLVFSPDGRRVAFVRWGHLVGGGGLTSSIQLVDFRVNNDGTIVRAVEQPVIAFTGEQLFDLSWSLDGTRL